MSLSVKLRREFKREVRREVKRRAWSGDAGAISCNEHRQPNDWFVEAALRLAYHSSFPSPFPSPQKS